MYKRGIEKARSRTLNDDKPAVEGSALCAQPRYSECARPNSHGKFSASMKWR
jgi:hypothetical protein